MAKLNKTPLTIRSKRGTEAEITSYTGYQLSGEIAYATDTKEFYVSDGTQFNKIGKDQLSQFSEISVVNDVNTWYLSADNILDLNPPEANPTGITFKPDGTKMFTIGYSRNRVQMYDLSTAWDLTSAGSPTESEYLVQGGLAGTQEDFFIDSSGTRMYVISRGSDSIGQFTLNTAWDISDITFVRDIHVNSTSDGGFVTGETNPAGITFKPDGTIMYIAGYQLDEVQQIPLSTAWDISTHGTITSVSILPSTECQGIQFSVNGKEMYILGNNLDGIVHFTLSTAWDVTTANLTERTQAFIRANESTPTGLFYRDDLNKCFIVGRSSDFAREIIANDVFSFNEGIKAPVVYSPELKAKQLTTGGGGDNIFFNTTYARSTFQSDSTTYLGSNQGSQNVRVGNTVYGNYRFHVFQGNYINTNFINNPTGDLPNIRFFNPLVGGVGVFSIGKTHNTSTVYLRGGVTDIDSEADTFSHLGEFTLRGELKVTGNQPLRYKDPNLYTQGTQIVLDNFTEASDTDLLNHTPDTGSGYTEVYVSSGANNSSDYAKISGGNGYVGPARNNSSDGFRFTNDTTISTANYEARALIKRQVRSDKPFVLFVKYIDEDNYFAMHFAANYSYCTPMSVVGGVHTQHGALYYYANSSAADNINFEVALRVVGNNVHVFYEGRYRGSREVNITGIGKAGIGFGRSNDSILTNYDLDTNAQISKFEIYELPDSLFDGSDSVHYIENGKLGIGTTSPTHKLNISGSDNENLLLVESPSNDSILVVTGSGNVGIGTSTPVSLLTLEGAVGGDPMLRLKSTGTPTSEDAYMAFNRDNTNNQGYTIGLDSGDNSFKISEDGDSITGNNRVTILTGGNVGIGTSNPYQTLTVAGNITQTDNSYLISTRKITARDAAGLSLYNDGGQGIDIKDNNNVIVTSGNVGIGTASPDSVLEIASSTTTDFLKLTSGGSSASPIKLIFEKGATEQGIIEYNRNGDLEIYNSDGDGGVMINGRNSEAGDLYVADNGNVGIGTTSPAAKLDVAGHIYPSANNLYRLGEAQNKEWSYVATRMITGNNNRMVLQLSGDVVILRDHNTVGDGVQIKNQGSVVAQFGDASGTATMGIGTTTMDTTAILDIVSTSKGVLFPRMTETQRTAISSPATGLIVYQTDATEGLYIYKSTGWVQII